jgi:cytolysin-activating lysine-acyltransferase
MRFPASGHLDILAPGLIAQPWSEAEALGSAIWLWMHSSNHRDRALHTLNVLLIPAIKQRQFLLGSEAGRPVFFISWARLSPEAEQRYIRNNPLLMPEADWNSGERLWFLDWVAPFGHSAIAQRLLHRHLMANQCGYSLYHRGHEKGLKIKRFHGKAVLPQEAQGWFDAHPVTDPQTGILARTEGERL